MFLSDGTLHKLAAEHDLWTPYRPEKVQPCSVDFTLDYAECTTYDDIYVVNPSQHCLAVTNEWVNLPAHIGARVEGKSSLGRVGLFVHITAGWIDAGFRGNITLELFNCSEKQIVLAKDRDICQMAFFALDRPALQPYIGKYQDSKGLVHSKETLTRLESHGTLEP